MSYLTFVVYHISTFVHTIVLIPSVRAYNVIDRNTIRRCGPTFDIYTFTFHKRLISTMSTKNPHKEFSMAKAAKCDSVC